MLSPIQIITGIFSALVVAAILYCFRMRQIYLVVFRLFQYSKLNQSAKTVELIIINRGRQSEEEIMVEFDPAHTYQMIASTSPGIMLEGSLMQIQRIPPRDEVSVILETTCNGFSKKNVAAISSKTSKGDIYEKLEAVPPNAGNVALFIAAIILIPLMTWFSIDAYSKYTEQKESRSIHDVSRAGWKNIDRYAQSTLVGFYPKGEFPVEIRGHRRTKDIVILDIDLNNKTDDWIKFSVKIISPADSKDPNPSDNRWIHDVMVAPKEAQKRPLKAYLPTNFTHQTLWVEVNIQYKNDHLYGLQKQMHVGQ
jgi:hypothetical protein